jgi:DNA-binding XRE family transcriptional regulator
VKDEYIDLYKHHVKVDNMKQYIEENVTTYHAISNWDLFVELKNGDRFIYDSFSNTVIFDLYETDELTDEQELKEFARNLKKMIRRSFITQEELADRIGVNRVSINRYLNGKQIPDSMTLHKIAKALNCSTEDFFYRKY